MRKILLMLSLALLLAACASVPPPVAPAPPAVSQAAPPPSPSNDCTDEPGSQPVNIHYGDSQIKVTPALYTIKTNKNLKFRLIADNVNGPGNLDYATVLVTIEGKDGLNQWINTSGKENGTNPLVVCVPDFQQDRVVSYLVKVEEVGVLDPRVDVKK
ncbi:MAG: hypothetical protein HKN57_01055 [Xanthomonadales bacterium]|nr:hypothetical protein [Gammaproteobacteria bacterium]MBT8055187.1 hypothetical protein [Gammaproteobacteria bacterium]NND55817.1 hypothetical protein [Xanthomonadales bacterium]NNK51360.1 hypothetical protein [Xanthomonadales bacterium]